MQSFVDELVSQSTQTGMIVNGKKMKEMVIANAVKKSSNATATERYYCGPSVYIQAARRACLQRSEVDTAHWVTLYSAETKV